VFKNTVAKWLDRAKTALNAAKTGAEVVGKAKDVFRIFGVDL
jgi:hypothetical protein